MEDDGEKKKREQQKGQMMLKTKQFKCGRREQFPRSTHRSVAMAQDEKKVSESSSTLSNFAGTFARPRVTEGNSDKHTAELVK